MTTMTSISAADFVKRILAGERNFESTQISAAQGDFAAQSDYAEMNRYLAGLTDLRDNPIVLNNIDWRGVKAPSIYLLGAKMAGANFEGADLCDADLRRSDLSGANFRGANVSGAVFIGARLMESDFDGATMLGSDLYEANISKGKLTNCDLTGAWLLRLNLGGADLTGSKITNAMFYRSDLRGIVGLDTVRDLATCQFKHTMVTLREKGIIEAALNARPLFELRDE
jgi:uncharacterized protein YjbI with pentapeptide repeats